MGNDRFSLMGATKTAFLALSIVGWGCTAFGFVLLYYVGKTFYDEDTRPDSFQGLRG